MGINLGVLLPGSNRSGQSRFLSLGGNGSGVEQVSSALLGFLLSGKFVRSLVLLLGNGRTEFVRYPVERIVERGSEQAALVNDLRRLVFTYSLRGIHCT